MAIINCKKISTKILKEVTGGTLGVLRNYDDPSAISYVRQLIKTARQNNVSVVEEDFGSQTIPESLNRRIEDWNQDEEINGIIVVSPKPEHYPCLDLIAPEKEVEGNDFNDDVKHVSCTARSCAEIIESVSSIEGSNILIIGYGKAVGKPLSYLLMRRHAGSVTTTHQYTKVDDLFNCFIPDADIIVTAAGKGHAINGDYEGKIFIDAGVSLVNGIVCGDVHPDLAEKNDITPVPGGVGPVTIALLLRNVSLSAEGKF